MTWALESQESKKQHMYLKEVGKQSGWSAMRSVNRLFIDVAEYFQVRFVLGLYGYVSHKVPRVYSLVVTVMCSSGCMFERRFSREYQLKLSSKLFKYASRHLKSSMRCAWDAAGPGQDISEIGGDASGAGAHSLTLEFGYYAMPIIIWW